MKYELRFSLTVFSLAANHRTCGRLQPHPHKYQGRGRLERELDDRDLRRMLRVRSALLSHREARASACECQGGISDHVIRVHFKVRETCEISASCSHYYSQPTTHVPTLFTVYASGIFKRVTFIQGLGWIWKRFINGKMVRKLVAPAGIRTKEPFEAVTLVPPCSLLSSH